MPPLFYSFSPAGSRVKMTRAALQPWNTGRVLAQPILEDVSIERNRRIGERFFRILRKKAAALLTQGKNF
jgi:hypothetical protein